MTRQRTVNGVISKISAEKIEYIKPTRLVVRTTSDEIGESLSIADEKSGIMMQIAVESVRDLIRLTRKQHINGGRKNAQTR